MKFKTVFLISFLFLSLLFVACGGNDVNQTRSNANSMPSPPPKVKRFMEFFRSPSNAKSFLSHKVSDGFTQVVFVIEKTRYTVYLSNENGTVTFWTRPDGTLSDNDLEMFSDKDMDDVVDFAQTGGTGEERKFFDSGIFTKDDRNRPYWQDKYSNALQKIVTHFKLE